MYTSLVKLKLQEIFDEKPQVKVAGAIDMLDRENYHCKYPRVHYRLQKIKNDNYFSLASNIFFFTLVSYLEKL